MQRKCGTNLRVDQALEVLYDAEKKQDMDAAKGNLVNPTSGESINPFKSAFVGSPSVPNTVLTVLYLIS
jgi:hypothetical protein